MPTTDQLNEATAAPTDDCTVTNNDDGSIVTDWPDGTQRVEYPDSSQMVTFPDGAVLNLYADGSKTLNDANGNALDPATGAPLDGVAQAGPTDPDTTDSPATTTDSESDATADAPIDTPPDMGPDKILRLMRGDDRIGDVQEAVGLVDTLKEAIEGEIDPAEWVKMWFEMVLAVIKALETEERGAYYRGWCYTVLYGALDMGTPPEPTFSGSLRGADQDDLDRQGWRDGVDAATSQLADGASGTGLRNRVLLRVARNGSANPQPTLREMYVAACEHTDDKDLRRAYEDILGWPQPTGA